MKKYLFPFLVSIMLLALLTSCTALQSYGSDSSNVSSPSDTDTSSDNTKLPDASPEAPKDDIVQTPVDSQPDTPEPAPDKNEVYTSTLMYTYVFNHIYDNDGVPYAILLTDYNYLSSSFGNIVAPKDITAGDTISIVHTGSIVTQETYPGKSFLKDGEVISYSFNYAEVIHLAGNDFSVENVKNNYSCKYYVILDRSGRYIPLDNYTGNELYLVVDEMRGKNNGKIEEPVPDGKRAVACMLAYNPRDLEDGVPPGVSAEQAIKIAEEHFYNSDYKKIDAPNYVYTASLMEGPRDGCWYVFVGPEYVGSPGGDIIDLLVDYYTYMISKADGEIISVEVT